MRLSDITNSLKKLLLFLITFATFWVSIVAMNRFSKICKGRGIFHLSLSSKAFLFTAILSSGVVYCSGTPFESFASVSLLAKVNKHPGATWSIYGMSSETNAPSLRSGLLRLGRYRWFLHDVTKIQTKKLSILPRFYFHDALEQLKTNCQTNFCFKRVLGFVIEYA